jgi:hypothetical protein
MTKSPHNFSTGTSPNGGSLIADAIRKKRADPEMSAAPQLAGFADRRQRCLFVPALSYHHFLVERFSEPIASLAGWRIRPEDDAVVVKIFPGIALPQA